MIMAAAQVCFFWLLASTGSTAIFAASLWLIGSCYGGGFAICPALVADTFGTNAAPRVYGLALTAWSAAALASPPLAAWMQQATGSYTLILGLCAAVSVVGLLVLATLRLVTAKYTAPLEVHAPVCAEGTRPAGG
jgi:MFS transporter, OFA family, oxalate/formate antiporter